MKKLKIKLLYSFIIILFILSIIICLISKPNSIYKEGYTSLSGKIISCDSMVLKSKERLLLTGSDKCILGSRVKVSGIITKPNYFKNFNLFNYQNYLYSKKINYVLKVHSIKIISNGVFIYDIKNNLIKYIKKFKSKDYLMAFVLGDNSLIEKRVIDSYQSNGISHLFAISGMHVTVISYIVFMLFKKRKYSFFVLLFVLFFYMFLTGFSPSVVRASLLFIALSISYAFDLKIKSYFILLFLFSINLIINPFIIYRLGFILSYIVSFYLSLFNGVGDNYFERLFYISFIAFISSIPIIIQNFFEINLCTIFINLLFVPLVSLIIYPLSLLTLVFPFLDNIFYSFTIGMENLSILASRLFFLKITLSSLSFFFFVFYFILITYVLYCFRNKKLNGLIILLLVFIVHGNINYLNSFYSTYFLDVGQGDSIFIKFPHNKGNILVDTGGITGNYDFDLSKKVIVPFLKSQGVSSLNYLIITHGDYDHMGEAINLVNNFKVEKVIFNCGEYNDLEKELIKVLDKKHIKYYSCIKELNTDKNKLYFLQTKEYDNENDNSNVIYTEVNGYKFMFMGDASTTTEKEILSKYNLPNIDVLKVGHHGSKTSSSKDFINEINPEYSIISVGKNNRYGHPNKEVLNNLEDSKIYRTDKDGSIMFKIKNNKLNIETCSP